MNGSQSELLKGFVSGHTGDLKVHTLSIKPHGLYERETCSSTVHSKLAFALSVINQSVNSLFHLEMRTLTSEGCRSLGAQAGAEGRGQGHKYS